MWLLDRRDFLAVFTGHDHAGACTLLGGIHSCTQRAVIDGSGPDHNAYTTLDFAVRPSPFALPSPHGLNDPHRR